MSKLHNNNICEAPHQFLKLCDFPCSIRVHLVYNKTFHVALKTAHYLQSKNRYIINGNKIARLPDL